MWEDKFIEQLIENKILNNDEELPELLKKHKIDKNATKGFSVNMVNEEDEQNINTDEISNYFTKFLILINLLFRISYVNPFDFKLGYKKVILKIFEIFTIQLFDLDNKKSLFSVENIKEQIIFFVIFFIWLICFISLFIFMKRNKIKVTFENNRIKYSYPILLGVIYNNLV
jgi:hypothetical protein